MNKEPKWDSVLKQIGELEDKEEEILGKEVAEKFFRTRRIDPNWDDSTKKRITELEEKISQLQDEIDEIEHEENIQEVGRFLREMLSPEYEFRPEDILRDCLKKVNLQEFESIARDVLNETNASKIRGLLDVISKKGIDIEKSVLLEKEKEFAEWERSLKEYTDFIRKYAEPGEIEVITVGDELFHEKLVGKEFTVVDMMRQELGGLPSLVHAIIEIDGKVYLLMDEDTLIVNLKTGERINTLGGKLAYLTKYRQLPLKVSIERQKGKPEYYKWKIIK